MAAFTMRAIAHIARMNVIVPPSAQFPDLAGAIMRSHRLNCFNTSS
jgi:hypothetical protein